MIYTNKIEYCHHNWIVIFYDNLIIFKCTLLFDGGHQEFGREYDLPADIRDISIEGDYIRITHGERLTEFKLEGESCIVGDVWEDGNVVDSIAMHDFWDEVI